MRNIKIEMKPGYSKNDGTKDYQQKIDTSIEFDNEAVALAFLIKLNQLIIDFGAELQASQKELG